MDQGVKGSIRQRSAGTWELTVDQGRDGLGRRQRRFVTVRGTKAQAQRHLRELLSTIDRGLDLPPDKVLLRDWLDRWLREVVAPNRRRSTVDRYESVIRRHLAPAIGHVELGRLAPGHVHAVQARLLARGMTPRGVGMVHGVLSSALTHAMRLEMVYRNPVSLVAKPTVVRQETVAPNMEAVRAVLRLAESEEHPLFACIHLIAYTGVRRGEVLGLTWDNVDLRGGRIRIVASLGRRRLIGLLVDPPKTSSGRRIIDLDDGTVAMLVRHREQQQETKAMMREAYLDAGRVFAGACGQWINPDRLLRAVQSLGQRVGEPGMTVRSLRHFHASVTLQSGQNPVVVSKRLGHASVSITSDVYAHALPGWQKQAADAFAKAMDGEW